MKYGLVALCLAVVYLSNVLEAEDRVWKRSHKHHQRAAVNEWYQEEQMLLRLEKTLEEDFYSDEDEAKTWIENYNQELQKWSQIASSLEWDYLTNMTDENSKKSEDFSVEFETWIKSQESDAKEFYKYVNTFSDKNLIRLVTLTGGYLSPVNEDPKDQRESVELKNQLEQIYAGAFVEKDGKKFFIEPELTEVMASSRDYDELVWAWRGWRNATGRKMKEKYARRVELMNSAAEQAGYTDIGQHERLADFEDDGIQEMAEGLYDDLQPLYLQVHAYVRRQLIKAYPKADIKPDGPIPAHLLGNMWAQQWNNIAPLVLPYPDIEAVDVTDNMKKQGYTPLKMFQAADEFFQSIGLEPMFPKFWEKSMIEKPADRSVQCHGSAHDLYKSDDFRIKMCTVVNQEDFHTVHHEMGHIQYFMQYRNQTTTYRTGANAAFHEAIGDTMSLSVMTPEHLRKVGLLTDQEEEDKTLQEKKDLNFLMSVVLQKIVFLPFALLMDIWRWDVFSGKVKPEHYNGHWWKLRGKFQGLSSPVPRSEVDFDPGAKYHIPVNVGYIRYYFSFISQFQFHKALCEAKGHKGPIHRCDIYQSKEAGDKLKSVLQLGHSKPWQDAMELMTGQREVSVEAIQEYFKPLIDWLKIQNKNEKIGWEEKGKTSGKENNL